MSALHEGIMKSGISMLKFPAFFAIVSIATSLYTRDPTTKEWIFQQKLVPADAGAIDDHFGSSVDIYDSLVVDAYWDDDKGEDS